MLTRRGFVGCALCAISGFIATGVAAQTPGVKRTVLTQIDGPVDGYVTISVRAEIEAGAQVARHTHPGVESSYIVSGGSTLSVKGQPDRVVKAGEGFQIPPETPHSVRNGPEKSRIVATFIVEKDKPLASPEPE